MENFNQLEYFEALKNSPISIKRSSSCFRPLYVNITQISRICLHDGNSVIYTNQSGWLEHHATFDRLRDCDVIEIRVPQVRNARKLDLSKKDNFILRYADREKSYYEEGYALYLYVTDFKSIKTVKRTNDEETQIAHAEYFQVSLDCDVCTPQWNEETEKTDYVAVPMKQIILRGSLRFEDTKKGSDLKELTNKINEALGRSAELSTYSVEKLLKKFTIKEI